jgi:hypothetical protein
LRSDHRARHHRCAEGCGAARRRGVARPSAALAGYQSGRDDLSAGLFSITDDIASFAWDMPRLQALHKSLSDEMSREVADVYAGDLSVIRA